MHSERWLMMPCELQVRDVAPHKRMYCLTFDLPLALLRGEYGSNTRKAAAEPAPQ